MIDKKAVLPGCLNRAPTKAELSLLCDRTQILPSVSYWFRLKITVLRNLPQLSLGMCVAEIAMWVAEIKARRIIQ
jgi:hypothetical protein